MWSVLEKVRAAVERHRMIPAGTRVAVAVSGGIDSVVLLDVLREIAPKLAVLHLNHRLRGAESDEDERFVSTCQRVTASRRRDWPGSISSAESSPMALPTAWRQDTLFRTRRRLYSTVCSGERAQPA
jgi:tRNA(Ile)-lysidine synthase TilS/MesJ